MVMKRWILIAPVALAACGGGEDAAENRMAAAATELAPGLYEVRSEVTAFEQLDQGQAKIDTPVGTSATEQVCVAPGDRPISTLFTGSGFDCDYSNYYGRNGRMNHTLNCSREGADGNVGITVNGSFTGDSFEVEREITTTFAGEGDVRTAATVTGRRVGDCPADGAEPDAGAEAE